MEIARAVALRHGVKVNDVLGSRLRQRHLTAARREISHKLREIGWSYPAIGDFLHRDHTSVMNLVKGRSEARRQREKIRWATREVVQ
ncbi:MAG TPA: helix-turn-helix domain-containing protein [bacterium]|nr:helix-turn-helix domain-containing protein [bacterium]